MSDTRIAAPPATSTVKLARVRGASIGAIFMLVIQFVLGILYNLYGSAPAGKSIGMFSNGWLIAHEIMAILLLAAAVQLAIRALGTDNGFIKATSVIGLVAIIAAIGAGIGFLGHPSNGGSLGMSLAFAVALVCYVLNIVRLPATAGS